MGQKETELVATGSVRPAKESPGRAGASRSLEA